MPKVKLVDFPPGPVGRILTKASPELPNGQPDTFADDRGLIAGEPGQIVVLEKASEQASLPRNQAHQMLRKSLDRDAVSPDSEKHLKARRRDRAQGVTVVPGRQLPTEDFDVRVEVAFQPGEQWGH